MHPKTLVVNDPAHVRNAPEKIFVTEFPDLMPPTLITRDLAEIKAFRAEHGDIVMKPLYGKGGEAVFRLAARRPQFRLALRPVRRHLPRALGGAEIPAGGEAGRQAHHPGRRRVRRRGQPRAGAPTTCAPTWCAAAPPKETDLTAREREICERLGPALRERGLLFVGIDVIDGYLTEINVTSPTGIRAIKNLGGPDVAAMIWDAIEAKRQRVDRVRSAKLLYRHAPDLFRPSTILRHSRSVAERRGCPRHARA